MFSRIGVDVRLAARAFTTAPTIAAVAVLTVALGVGATTAIFSVVDAVVLRPLPFPEPQRLVSVFESFPAKGWVDYSLSHANFWDLRDLNHSLAAVGAYTGRAATLTGSGAPERVSVGVVSAGFFEALAVRPVAGRVFRRGEDEPGQDARVAVLANGFWTTRYGADRGIVGRSLVLDGQSHTVIGVLPAGASWLESDDLFVPLTRDPTAGRVSLELAVVARLRPGTTMEAARADLRAVSRRLAEQHPAINEGMRLTLGTSADWMASPAQRRAVWILMAGVTLLLVIACVNLASLLLARSVSRTRERAVRLALGAGRLQVARQWLVEALSLTAPGMVLGVGLAWLAVAGLRAAGPAGVPRVAEIGINRTVLLFALATSLVAAGVGALVPACAGARDALVPALREGERGMAGGRRARRLRGVLVGAEIAASLVALVAAALLTRSFTRILSADRGFQVDHRLTFSLRLPNAYFAEKRARPFVTEFLRRLERLPGVVSAAAVNRLPLAPESVGMGVAVPGAAVRDADVPWATWRVVTPGYFRTIGVPLLRGRTLTEADAACAGWRVVVSQRLATLLWPGQDPIGRTMLLWKGQEDRPAEVVGVVGDMRERGLTSDPTLAVYFNREGAALRFVVRTRGPEAALVAPIRAAVAAMDPGVAMSGVRTMEDILSDSIASSRLTMATSATIGLIAFLLALVGIQGVLAHAVARRTAEIGVRVALGATRRRVLGLVLVEGMRPVVVGAGIGLTAALAMARLVKSLLFGITPTDPGTYVGVLLALTAAAAVACAVPAYRASRVNVVTALRSE